MERNTMDLQLFAEGGAGGDGGNGTPGAVGAGAVQEGVGTAPSKEAPVYRSTRRGAKANPYSNVVFGKQGQPGNDAAVPKSKGSEAPASAQTGEESKASPPADRNAAFEGLITGEYKDLYEQKLADARKQGEDSMRVDADRYKQMASVMEIIGRKHGLSPDQDGNFDLSKLSAAVKAEEDDYFAELALKTGKSEADLRQEHLRSQRMQSLERENKALKAANEQRLGQEHARRVFAGWVADAEKAKAVYPSLDLMQELKNPKFEQLLHAGVDVKSAYMVIHKDEIMPAAMQYAARKVEDNMAGKIAAQAARPVENGGGGSPVQVKTDVTQLTKAERQEIIRRVRRGDRIVF